MEFCEFTVDDALYVKRLNCGKRGSEFPLRQELTEEDTGRDFEQMHFGVLIDGWLVASVSINPLNADTVQLRQMVVDKDFQGKGVGAFLVANMEDKMRDKGFQRIELNARLYAEPFYRKQGYQTVGEIYQLIGIDHIKMWKKLGQ